MTSLEQDDSAKKCITDLPIELLRMIVETLGMRDRLNARLCCSALEEAVATSKFSCRIMELKYDYESTMFKVTLEASRTMTFRLFACTIGTVAQRTLQWRMRMFGKLRVRLIDIRVVNQFLDACIFDKLIVHISRPEGLSTRIYDLIAKAQIRVDLHIRYFVPTITQLMTFSRPVIFHFFKMRVRPLKDEHFLSVLRRGHSIPYLDNIKLRSEETVAEAVKIVSGAIISQTLRIGMEPNFLRRLLHVSNAKEIEPLKEYHDHSYTYLRAHVCQYHTGWGDLLVNSLYHDEQQEPRFVRESRRRR